MIILIINSFIELYGIHKKRYWIILFTCIFKLSAVVFIIVHIYITSGNNYLFYILVFYITTKIKLVSKSEENSRENDELLPKFHKRKQSHVSLTSILSSSNNKPEKKISPKKNTEEIIDNPELDQVWAASNKNQQILTKNNPDFDRLYTINGMLGKGGFGQVYSGVRNNDLKPVAIKIIKKQTYCSKLVWPTNFDGQVVPLEVYL